MPNTWCLRFNKPVKYTDMTVDEYEQRLVDMFIRDDWWDVVMVREYGDEGNNPHWHAMVTNKFEISALRKHLNAHYDVSGNEEFSIKAYDPNKAAAWKRYLAKGPLGKRLVMPIVVVDDIGLLWERLHHEYHDEALAIAVKKRRYGDGVKKMTAMEQFLAHIRLDVEKKAMKNISVEFHKNYIYEMFQEFFKGRAMTIDPYIVDKFLYTAHCEFNPYAFDSMRSRLKFFEGTPL